MSLNTAVLDDAPQTPSKPTKPPERDAIIFVPGLKHDAETQSVDVVAFRTIHALNRQADSGAAAFVVSEGKEEDYLGNKTRTITVSRKDGQDETSIFDLYGFDYKESLIGQHEKRKPFVQALVIFWLLLSNWKRMVAAFKRKSKSSTEKYQTVMAGGMFFLLTIYMLMLLGTAIGTAADMLWQRSAAPSNQTQAKKDTLVQQEHQQQQQQQPDAPAPAAAESKPKLYARVLAWVKAEASLLWAVPGEWISFTWDRGKRVLQFLVILLTTLGLFTKLDLKQALARVSGETTCATQYLQTGSRSGAVAGQFSALLDYIEEKASRGGPRYRRIHVVGFSFGTVVVLDALFPFNAIGKRTRRVDTLVTVGCPFDFIRTYWPQYFDGRESWDGVPDQGVAPAPRRWVNIYAPADVLGSNFLDEVKEVRTADGGPEQKMRGVGRKRAGERHPDESILFGRDMKLDDYSFFERVGLVGFKVHTLYWEKGQTFDVNCFDHIVERLYRDEFALS